MNLGILIIGSLIWETDKGRPEWRNDRLREDLRVQVSARIRYGRLSSGRENTYTMVLSRKADPGTALVVPCRRNITGVDLFDEALYLWRAESGKLDAHVISDTWGCVALLVRDLSSFPKDLLQSWSHRVSTEPDYGNIAHAHDEGVLVSKDGFLQIDWPTRVDNGNPVEFDALLATTNQPSLTGNPKDYPSPEEIARRWISKPTRKNYLTQNIENQITTFQDDAILKALKNPV